MLKEELFLFPKKEIYLLDHDKRGRSIELARMPKLARQKRFYENMHLMSGLTFVGKNLFPQMQPYTGDVNFDLVPFVERNKHSGKNEALHFFLDDYRFRNAVWENLEKTTHAIAKFDYVFTPDYSMWVDVPTDFFNKINVFRTRYIGAYWQRCGFNVIPTVSWGDANSISYAFDGLPQHSVLAVCGVGNKRCRASMELWKYAIRCIEQSLSPIMIIVYGEQVEISGIHTPLKFFPDFISTHFRK